MALSVASIAVAMFAVRYAREKTARSLSLKRLVALESEMTDISEALDSVRAAMHKIRSRINMREKRRGSNGVLPPADGEPDPQKDPEAWYRWARAKHLPPIGGK